MPVINTSIVPVVVIAPRPQMSRAIRDDEVSKDVAQKLKPAFEHGPGHRATPREVSLEAHARRMQASGGGMIKQMRYN